MKKSQLSPGARIHRSSSGRMSLARKVSAVLTGRPGRAAVSMFVLVIAVFTGLLSLPVAAADGQPTALTDAAVMATSAVTVTGLTSVDIAHFSFFGQLMILLAVQLGGLGIVTLAVWLTLLVSRRLSLRSRILSIESLGISRLGEVPALLITVVVFAISIEAVLVLAMLPIFVAELGAADGIFHAVFYAVSAFSNAGFTLGPTGLDHPIVMTTINVGVFAGALGFPVVYMLYRMIFYRARMNLHTRLTLEVTVILLVVGAVLIACIEWHNPATLGPLSIGEKLHHAVFASGMTRSGGFTTYSVVDQADATLVISNVLMFIGGGSGSTAGGIKVTTLAVLLLAIIAEIRGEEQISIHRREIPNGLVRVAVAVVMAAALVVTTGIVLLTLITQQDLATTSFEAFSAFGTVGLSTGLTASAAEPAQWVLIGLMLLGRIGPITFAAGLAARHKPSLFRYPSERPIIG